MDEHQWLAEQFEMNRAHLQGVAYRMLGSLSEADDAVQESWFRLSRSDRSGVENIGGWLTTVVSRVCLDMLRSRKARREESMEAFASERVMDREAGGDPEHEALLADSIGLALLVVLGTLNPVERIAFVLHDVFDVSFAEIAPIVGRSDAATRQLASRARRRVRGAETEESPAADLSVQKSLVDSFLAAARAGDLGALINVLDPDIVLRSDSLTEGAPSEVRGAHDVAGKLMYGRAQAARPVLVNGSVGVIVAPRGHLLLVLVLAFERGKIVAVDQVADPSRVQQLNLAVLNE